MKRGSHCTAALRHCGIAACTNSIGMLELPIAFRTHPKPPMQDASQRTIRTAGLFFAFLSLLLALGTWGQFKSGALQAGTIQSIVLLPMIALTAFLLTRPKDINDPACLRADLRKRRDRVVDGTYRYRGMPIDADTVFVQYLTAISLGFVSYRMPSRYYVVGRESTGLVRGLSTALSALLGWWGLPHGPRFTREAIAVNRDGGIVTPVRDILNDL